MSIETAQKRELDTEMKIPDSNTVQGAVTEAIKAMREWTKSGDRPNKN